jgi:hypothetical protein
MGSCMKHSRIIGKNPMQVVQRRCCSTCHTEIYDRRPIRINKAVLFNCASCRVPVATRLMEVDDWHQVHAVESQNHKFSRVPASILHDRGSEESEARAERAKSRDPAAQVWFDFSHDDTYLHTDRFPVLHIKSARIVADMLPPEVVDAAEEVFVRQGVTAAQAMQTVFEVVKYSVDRLRENAGPDSSQRIPRKAIATKFDLDIKSVKAYTRVHVSDGSKGDSQGQARMGYRYSPPMAQLLEAIESAVKELNRQCYGWL